MCQTKHQCRLSRMIHWWKWWANEGRPTSSPWGGGTNPLIARQYRVRKGLTLWGFDSQPWLRCSYEEYMVTISDSTHKIHIVGSRNMSPVKECSPPDFRLHNCLCCDTPTLSYTFMGWGRRGTCFHCIILISSSSRALFKPQKPYTRASTRSLNTHKQRSNLNMKIKSHP